MTYHTFESVKQDAKRTADKKNPIYSEMSLRDYFAAKAMQAVITGYATQNKVDSYSDYWAGFAYEMADAMLAEREKS
jgi:hypothetical protein